MKNGLARAGVLAVVALLGACTSDDKAEGGGGGGAAPPAAKLARCSNMSAEPFVTRNDLAPGSLKPEAQLLLRFVQFSDNHIIDDEAQAINGAGFTDPLYIAFESAMRLQEEYSDEVFNDMIAGVNACKGQSACKSANSSCKGQNACKGQGWVETSTTLECVAIGGRPMN